MYHCAFQQSLSTHAISAVKFDSSRSLLWAGSESRLTSLAVTPGLSLVPHTSFPLPTGPEAVDDPPIGSLGNRLASSSIGILSASGTRVSLRSHSARLVWDADLSTSPVNPAAEVTRALAVAPAQPAALHSLVVSAHPATLLTLDLRTRQTLRSVSSGSNVAVLAASPRLVACGDTVGCVQMRDPRSLALVHSLPAHSAAISDLAVAGNTLITCGLSETPSFRRRGALQVDPMVKVYDLRMMRSLLPVPFPAGPSFVRFHPKLSSLIITVGQTGQFQICDLGNPDSNVQFYQLDMQAYCTSFDVSSSGELLLFGDSSGVVHMWSEMDKDAEVNLYSRPLEGASSHIYSPPPPLDIDDDFPLNMVGMPYYDEPLLSNFPPSLLHRIGRPCPFIPPSVLKSVKTIDFVGYAPNPQPETFKRNQSYVISDIVKAQRPDVPKFRSEQEREAIFGHNSRGSTVKKGPQAPVQTNTKAKKHQEAAHSVPKFYRRHEIKYSKFGIEDFDFGYFNKTTYSGLETHIRNSYTNAFLQVLRFTKPLQQVCESHSKGKCIQEVCFACELGFLFKMLEDARGVNCQATNFLRAFGSMHQASALGLLEPDGPLNEVPYGLLIQNFNRFLLDKLNQELESETNPTVYKMFHGMNLSPIHQIFGMKTSVSSKCLCGRKSSRETQPLLLQMQYPRKTANSGVGKEPMVFTEVLKLSLSSSTQTKAWCEKCKRYNLLTQTKRPESLPTILNISANVVGEDDVEAWIEEHTRCSSSNLKSSEPKGPRLPSRIGIIVSDGAVEVWDLDSAANSEIDVTRDCITEYELSATVACVRNDKDPAHLISHIKLPIAEGHEEWFLFNDFSVRPVSLPEVTLFKRWKMPSIIQYTRQGAPAIFNRFTSPSDHSLLMRDTTILNRRRDLVRRARPLSADEIPTKPGYLCAIDAEFVALNKEEIEIRSDGTKLVLRPSHLCLARVSVLRGQGPLVGVPFIDDFISIKEVVVDYLTEFSGISPDDLKPEASRHTLVPLKSAYKKLRLLVDMGCMFIGHGLPKDFRIINIVVPPEQVIDTVDIYHIKSRQRKISLRFLAWYVLKENIQQESHDSIEDARTALRLYQKYEEYKSAGSFERVLNEIYDEGRKLNWKPPAPPASSKKI